MRFLHEVGARAVRLVVVKPFVLLAAKVVGPGPFRLRMVKLAHELDDRQVSRIAA